MNYTITYFYKGTLHTFTTEASCESVALAAARKRVAAPITSIKETS